MPGGGRVDADPDSGDSREGVLEMRPENPYPCDDCLSLPPDSDCVSKCSLHYAYIVRKDAIGDTLDVLKKDALYGEYGEDFIISSRVKPKNKNWAEDFFKTLDGKGYLVFIKRRE